MPGNGWAALRTRRRIKALESSVEGSEPAPLRRSRSRPGRTDGADIVIYREKVARGNAMGRTGISFEPGWCRVRGPASGDRTHQRGRSRRRKRRAGREPVPGDALWGRGPIRCGGGGSELRVDATPMPGVGIDGSLDAGRDQTDGASHQMARRGRREGVVPEPVSPPATEGRARGGRGGSLGNRWLRPEGTRGAIVARRRGRPGQPAIGSSVERSGLRPHGSWSWRRVAEASPGTTWT